MSRVIPQRVYWLGSLAEARVKLQPCMNAFVAAANRGRPHSSPSNAAPLDAVAQWLLGALHSGRSFRFRFGGWPAWFTLAFLNIDSNVRSGDYHLRPCCVCGHWMLVKSAAREKCGRLACRRAEDRRRKAKSRENTEGTIARARRA